MIAITVRDNGPYKQANITHDSGLDVDLGLLDETEAGDIADTLIEAASELTGTNYAALEAEVERLNGIMGEIEAGTRPEGSWEVVGDGTVKNRPLLRHEINALARREKGEDHGSE